MVKKKASFLYKALACSILALWMIISLHTAFAEPLQTRCVAANGGLNVRREPTVQSRIVYTLDETDVVVVSEWKDGWALVCNNYPPYLPIGWACGDYLR